MASGKSVVLRIIYHTKPFAVHNASSKVGLVKKCLPTTLLLAKLIFSS